MNIAFTSVVLFLILAPGFVFRFSYNSSSLSLKYYNRNIIHELTWGIIPTIILQVVFFTFTELVTGYEIDFKLLGDFILGAESPSATAQNFQDLRSYVYPIFWYHISLFAFSYLLGYFLRGLVRRLKLDRKYRTLRFSNKWHYILSGECLDFVDIPDSYEEISYKIVDVLCKVDGKRIIYIGELFDYYIDQKGDLDAIHLRHPFRRNFDDDEITTKKYYDIQSRFLIIRSSEILNINVRYFNSEEISKEEFEALNKETKVLEMENNNGN